MCVLCVLCVLQFQRRVFSKCAREFSKYLLGILDCVDRKDCLSKFFVLCTYKIYNIYLVT